MRRLALFLARVATRILPPSRAEWAQAMEAELHYIDDDRAALKWVAGFLVTSLKERVNAMNARKVNLALAVFVAGLLLGAKWIWKSEPNAIFIIMALWALPFAYLTRLERKQRNCI